MSRINAIVPSYYKNFVCKCGACRTVCCQGWRITLSMKEYYSLIGLDCSPQLRDRLDRAFCLFERPDTYRYAYISHGYDGRCKILGDDGYCSMQRECGENVLPEVCRFYPRSVRHGKDGEQNTAVFSAGCENTVELLMSADTLTFSEERIVIPGDDIPADAGDVLTGERKDTMFSAISSLQDRSVCFTDRLKKLCGASLPVADKVEVFSALVKFICRLASSSRNISQFGLDSLAHLGIDIGNPDSSDFSAAVEKYISCRDNAHTLLPDLDIYYENLFVNHIYYMQFPFIDSLDRTEASAALLALFAMLDIICCGCIDLRSEVDPSISFADSASAVFRMAEHSDYYRTASLLLRALNVGADAICSIL